MRLLLDESIPVKLRRALPNHDVRTVVEMGWSGVKNGKLLALAADEFDALVTVDKNLPYQQNLNTLPVAVIVSGCASRTRSSRLLGRGPCCESGSANVRPRER
jgi:predicted nuclease of predicted toxin-antitoxin system